MVFKSPVNDEVEYKLDCEAAARLAAALTRHSLATRYPGRRTLPTRFCTRLNLAADRSGYVSDWGTKKTPTCPNGAVPPDRDHLTPRADARDLSVSAGVTRAPTVPLGPAARRRIVLRRWRVVGGRHISLLFLKRRQVAWLRLAMSDRSLRNSEAPGALGARICSETGHT